MLQLIKLFTGHAAWKLITVRTVLHANIFYVLSMLIGFEHEMLFIKTERKIKINQSWLNTQGLVTCTVDWALKTNYLSI